MAMGDGNVLPEQALATGGNNNGQWLRAIVLDNING